MMTVRLIAHTPEPEKVVAAAAKLCYSDAHITDLLDGLDEEKTARFLTMLSDLGHASPMMVVMSASHIPFASIAVSGAAFSPMV